MSPCLARRRDRLEDAAKEAGSGAIAIRCDVTDESSCRDAIEEAAGALGGIDAMVYAPGSAPSCVWPMSTPATWRRVLDTNVMGAALVTSAALPHLSRLQRGRRLPLVGQRLPDPPCGRAWAPTS